MLKKWQKRVNIKWTQTFDPHCRLDTVKQDLTSRFKNITIRSHEVQYVDSMKTHKSVTCTHRRRFQAKWRARFQAFEISPHNHVFSLSTLQVRMFSEFVYFLKIPQFWMKQTVVVSFWGIFLHDYTFCSVYMTWNRIGSREGYHFLIVY